ncbi:phospholipase D-like domain-containing protein [Inhella proteolytica]|uniref:PLD phosphodiesterase domain-containing protein n=1 Tax=Inhella proteolytica TaxID=2795029 RepID=A0A931J5E7_9BURK|nr:phospholipase D-like domain-containing protein [Inhella proteolytica]MBH9577182.1 hypothetical protein [Inhella proteolytica]
MSTEVLDLRHNVAVATDTRADSTPQYWAVSRPYFAAPRHGNKAKFYVDGEALYKDVAAAIRSAQKFLLFVDWQMDFDVELVNRSNPNHPGRFSQLIAEQLDRAPALEVRILLYDSVESPAYTHENEVRRFMESLNRSNEPRRVQVAVQKPSTGRGWENIGFSHHQKLIVVDGKFAFVGGMDITYGRWDNGNFDVVADPYLHRINDMYNPGLAKGRELTAEEHRLTLTNMGRPLPAGSRQLPGFAEPYYVLSILLARVKELWAEGRTWSEVLVFIEALEVNRSLKKFLLEKYQAMVRKLQAAQKVYNDYMAKKRLAGQQMRQGRVLDAIGTSMSAEVDLGRIALQHMAQKLDAMKKSLQESWEATVADLEAKARDATYYAEDPSRLVDDARQAWEEVKALPDYFDALHALEEGCQPRMPWQDVHARIEGAAVFDIYKNIARRWNLCFTQADNRIDARRRASTPMDAAFLVKHGGMALFGDLRQPDGQGVSVQIVRSMSTPLVEQERALTANRYTGDLEATTGGPMKSVLEAMMNCIASAQAYVYIETQFFISQCGASAKGEASPANNPIAASLAARISRAIVTGVPFHVYLVLPVHPEGNLTAGPVAKQHYWILQTIKHGRQSLLRKICETLARKKKGSQLANISEPEVQAEMQADAWKPYITFLNLRNWGQTVLFEREPKSVGERGGERILSKEKGRFIITEQIYVHSKLLIVDDAVAIIGSANVNDRSLNGNGDSEIAAVIRDNDKQLGVDLGNGIKLTTRTFARDLRLALWRKHMGLEIKDKAFMRADREGTDNSKSGLPKDRELSYPPREATTDLLQGYDPLKPASAATVGAIRKTAADNARAYEEVFLHTPRNSMRKFSEVADRWPKRISKSGVATDAIRNGVRVAAPVTAVAVGTADAVLPVPSLPNLQSVTPDFGAEPPALAPAYMQTPPVRPAIHYAGKVHNMERAADHLRKQVTGFFVAMPLDFGIDEKNEWLGGQKGDFLIADMGSPSGIPSREAFEEKLKMAGLAPSESGTLS